MVKTKLGPPRKTEQTQEERLDKGQTRAGGEGVFWTKWVSLEGYVQSKGTSVQRRNASIEHFLITIVMQLIMDRWITLGFVLLDRTQQLKFKSFDRK